MSHKRTHHVGTKYMHKHSAPIPTRQRAGRSAKPLLSMGAQKSAALLAFEAGDYVEARRRAGDENKPVLKAATFVDARALWVGAACAALYGLIVILTAVLQP